MNNQLKFNLTEIKNKIGCLPQNWDGFLIARQYQELFGQRSGLSNVAKQSLTTFSDFQYEWRNPPVGNFIVHLDSKVYTHSSILKGYFRTLENLRFQLAVYASQNYKPNAGSVSLKDVSIGSWLQILTEVSEKSGNVRLSEVHLLETL